MDDTVGVNQITLQKLKVACSRMIGSTLGESLRYREREEIELMSMVVQLQGYVLADRIAEETQTAYFDVERPLSWWQMFKEQKFMYWYRKRWPVKYYTETKSKRYKFERYATYPRANINIPKQSQVYMMQLGGIEVIHDTIKQVP